MIIKTTRSRSRNQTLAEAATTVFISLIARGTIKSRRPTDPLLHIPINSVNHRDVYLKRPNARVRTRVRWKSEGKREKRERERERAGTRTSEIRAKKTRLPNFVTAGCLANLSRCLHFEFSRARARYWLRFYSRCERSSLERLLTNCVFTERMRPFYKGVHVHVRARATKIDTK